MLPPFIHFFNHIFRNRNFFICHSLCCIIPNHTFHCYKINNTFKIIFCTNWQLQRHCFCAQHFFYLLNNI